MSTSVILRNKDRFVDLVRVDLRDGTRGPAVGIDPYDYDSLQGFFQIWGGSFLAIFTTPQGLFFVRDRDILPIQDMRFDVTGPLEARTVTAWHKNHLLCRLTDSVHAHGYIEGDPTAFVDMEDFDFGLYAQRVSAQIQAKTARNP